MDQDDELNHNPFEHLAISDEFTTALEGIYWREAEIGTIRRTICGKIKEGPRTWYAAYGITFDNCGQIVIPAEGIEQMSDTEIARAIRRMAQEALILQLEEEARDFLDTKRDTYAPVWLYNAHDAFVSAMTQKYEQVCAYTEFSDLLSGFAATLRAYIEGTNPEAGFIYCLHDGQGHYKLGRTRNLSRRIRQLSTQPPFEITLEFAFRVIDSAIYERYLHFRYRSKRLRGEWFALTVEDVEQIKGESWAEVFYDIDGNLILVEIPITENQET